MSTVLEPNMHFFVVDDSSSRENIVKCLKTIGLKKVTESSSEGEALRLLKARKFDFIICAKNMEQMHGLEFLMTLQESMEIPRTPIMIAGDEIAQDEWDFYPETHPDGFLKTPIVLKELSSTISLTLKNYLENRNSGAEFEIARELFIDGEYEQALNRYIKIAENGHTSARALVGIARCHRALSHVRRAERFLRRAIEQNKRYAQAYFDLALCLLVEDEKDGALDAFNQAIQLSPRNPIHYETAANILTRLELYKDAENYLMRAIDLKLNYHELYAQAAKNFLIQKKREKAVDFFKRAIDQDPKNQSYLNSIGICYKEMGQYDLAITSYNSALKLSPSNTKIIFNKVLCYIAMKEFDKAKKCCYQILKISPKSDRVSKKLLEIEKLKAETAIEPKYKGIGRK